MSVRILQGDARERLKEIERADVVLTDPVWPNCPPDLLQGWDRPAELLREVVELLPPVRSVGIIIRSDSDPRFLSSVSERYHFICTQALSYAVPMYLGRVLGGTELVYWFGKPPPPREGKKVIPMWGPKAQPGDRKANGHPCSRAMVHMEWLVDWWSLPGETVLDPFCGSGTIPTAADRMQRHGIGIEIEPKWAALAERLANDDAGMFADVADQ